MKRPLAYDKRKVFKEEKMLKDQFLFWELSGKNEPRQNLEQKLLKKHSHNILNNLGGEKMRGKIRFKKNTVLVSLLVVGFSVSVLACNLGEAKQKLTVWLPPFGTEEMPDKQIWAPVWEEFERTHPGVEITHSVIPWANYEEKYLTAVAGRIGPDVGYMYPEMLPNMIETNSIVSLESYITPENEENCLYLDVLEYRDKRYTLPIVVGNNRVLFYNEDLLEEAGVNPPKTWEDFLRVAKVTTKDLNGDGKSDQWGFIQEWGYMAFGALNNVWYNWLWQAGGELFNEAQTKVKFNSPEGQEAAQFLYDLMYKYKVIPKTSLGMTGGDITPLFGDNKVAMWMNGTSTAYVFDKDYPKLRYGYVPYLRYKRGIVWCACDCLVMMSTAEDKELTWELMKHITSGESMTRFHTYSPWPPIAKDEDYHGHPLFKDLQQHRDHFRFLPLVLNGSAIYDSLYKNFQMIMNQQKTVKAGLDDAAARGNKFLSR